VIGFAALIELDAGNLDIFGCVYFFCHTDSTHGAFVR
jgi:hypothetical protein